MMVRWFPAVFALTVAFIVADVLTTAYALGRGHGEMNVILLGVQDRAGVIVMLAVLLVSKLAMLAIIDVLWRLASRYGSVLQGYVVAVALLVAVAAAFPVIHNLTMLA